MKALFSTVAKTAGSVNAETARIIMAAWRPTALTSNCWLPFLRPPRKAESPRISRVLPMIEPVMDAFTRSVSPLRRAKSVMMSSAAFPNVALSNPPRELPSRAAACSVASPIQAASGTRASAEAAKIVHSGAWTARHAIAAGSPRRSTLMPRTAQRE